MDKFFKCKTMPHARIRSVNVIGLAPDFYGLSLSYIGCRETLRRIWLVSMIAAERSPIRGVLRRAKSCTSMSCEYVDIHPVTGNFYSMVDHKSVRLFLCADTGHCFIFIIRHNLPSGCRRNFVTAL